ncbi:MAG: hypothetical protein ACI9JE_001767 [Candidatus Krumholzibacteriia bacterium]|jgi:hypothetical protein
MYNNMVPVQRLSTLISHPRNYTGYRPRSLSNALNKGRTCCRFILLRGEFDFIRSGPEQRTPLALPQLEEHEASHSFGPVRALYRKLIFDLKYLGLIPIWARVRAPSIIILFQYPRPVQHKITELWSRHRLAIDEKEPLSISGNRPKYVLQHG